MNLLDEAKAALQELKQTPQDRRGLIVPKDLQIAVDAYQLSDFCQRNHIQRLWLFGSVLREDFRPDSEVDVLVEFEPGNSPGLKLFDLIEDLKTMFGRDIDLVTVTALRNPFLRYEILSTRQLVYAA